ncbi:unannotated protein [freshwater metagenome]|uniref:Unannotated protein n=1 Tax=freshwater metagenome TaxID=449393 RepID=A0A6J7I0K6_9ZZZZ
MGDVFSILLAENFEHFGRAHLVAEFDDGCILRPSERISWGNAIGTRPRELNEKGTGCSQDHACDERPRR